MFIGAWELIVVFAISIFFVGAILTVVALRKRKD